MAARCLKDGAPGTEQPPLQACSPSLLSAPPPVSVREAPPGFRPRAPPEAPRGPRSWPPSARPVSELGELGPCWVGELIGGAVSQAGAPEARPTGMAWGESSAWWGGGGSQQEMHRVSPQPRARKKGQVRSPRRREPGGRGAAMAETPPLGCGVPWAQHFLWRRARGLGETDRSLSPSCSTCSNV